MYKTCDRNNRYEVNSNKSTTTSSLMAFMKDGRTFKIAKCGKHISIIGKATKFVLVTSPFEAIVIQIVMSERFCNPTHTHIAYVLKGFLFYPRGIYQMPDKYILYANSKILGIKCHQHTIFEFNNDIESFTVWFEFVGDPSDSNDSNDSSDSSDSSDIMEISTHLYGNDEEVQMFHATQMKYNFSYRLAKGMSIRFHVHKIMLLNVTFL